MENPRTVEGVYTVQLKDGNRFIHDDNFVWLPILIYLLSSTIFKFIGKAWLEEVPYKRAKV